MDFDLSKRWCWYFNELSKIPRPSFHEAAASAWIASIARKMNLYCHVDSYGNIVVRKPGSKGQEDKPWLMLQAHMDMVPATAAGFHHDWEKDPLDLYVEDGYLRARGTTLGADDGAGVAIMLAIMEDEELVHPPLEFVYTTAEETGLDGACRMKPQDIVSRRVINLDGGDLYRTMCCSSGGIKGVLTIPASFEKIQTSHAYSISLHGFAGGHSGIVIDEDRGNPLLLAGRFLKELEEKKIAFRLISINGGDGDNVIPRSCTLLIDVDDSIVFEDAASEFDAEIREEYTANDPGACMEIKTADINEAEAFESTFADGLITLLNLMPNGVFERDHELNIPVTSNNTGVIQTGSEAITIAYRIRSQLESGLDDIERKIEILAKIVHGSVKINGRYPGWNYVRTSKMREQLNSYLQKTYNETLTIEGCHSGTECGVWYSMHPGTDIISIGSVEEFIHTPDERMSLERFDKAYFITRGFIEWLALEQKPVSL